MNWNEFNINKEIIERLININFFYPTIIQKKVIPLILNKQNLVIASPTGSGKTHAFLIPIINNITVDDNYIQAIIITPTKELSLQIYEFAKELTINSNIKVVNVNKKIINNKKQNNNYWGHIVIGTVAKLKQLYQEKSLNLTNAKNLVIDECDMFFELDFVKDLDFLLAKINKNIQITVLSATIFQNLQIFLKKYFKTIKFINLTEQYLPNTIKHIFIKCSKDQQIITLLTILKNINPYLCLIFVNKKEDIDKIAKLLQENNKSTIALHGGLNNRARYQVYKKIKQLDYQYVISSDISARGIDIPGLSHVISLEVPYDHIYYLHRAGRTGRNNISGYSYLFYNDNDIAKIKQLQKILKNVNIEYYKLVNQKLVRNKAVKLK